MFKLAVLPLIIAGVSAMFTWAMVRHVEISGEQRAHARAQPRARPYATRLPKALRKL